MSDLIKNHWYQLHTLIAESSPVYTALILNSDKELIICLGEIFVNIGNLTIPLEEEEADYFSDRLSVVEQLMRVSGSRRDRRFLLRHETLVRHALRTVLNHLNSVSFFHG